MDWPAVRLRLQSMVPRSYWTALECHDDGAWTAFTPGLPVDGGMTIAGSRSAAYFEAQRRIAVTIRNMYEVGQRVPPLASAMSLSAAQAWDSSHRVVFEQLDEDVRGGAGNTSSAPKIVERQWRQVHVDLFLADDSPLAADRAELREALRQRGVRNIWASDPEESVVEEEEEEGDEDVDADEEDDDEMIDLVNDELGIVASDRPSAELLREQQFDSDEAFGQDSRSMSYNYARRGPVAAQLQRPRAESRLETLAGMVATEGLYPDSAAPPAAGQRRTSQTANRRAWPGPGLLVQREEGALGTAGTGGMPGAASAPAQAAAEQPSLRTLEHRDEDAMALPDAVRLAHIESAAEDRIERLYMQRREEAARTTRRHSERQRSFTRLYHAAQAGIGRPSTAHRPQRWKEGEGALC